MKTVAIIGSGRVGLPYGLFLHSKGYDVYFVDSNVEILRSIRSGKMPFEEPDCDELLLDYVAKHEKELKLRTAISLPVLAQNLPSNRLINCFIITVGTPVTQHIETDLTAIDNVIARLLNNFDLNDKIIALRSTIAPGTTDYVEFKITKKYPRAIVAFCPERLAEGKAIKELNTLPQIIGSNKAISVVNFFKDATIDSEIINVTIEEAELMKLFSNIYRYCNFAISNYMLYIADEYNVDFNSILDKMKYKYPRNAGLTSPGFTAGTCLRKDFGMIAENSYASDLLLSAYRVNEFMPKFIADFVWSESSVAIYGTTFKANSDDTRDSLTPKLIRYLERIPVSKISKFDFNDPEFKNKHPEYSVVDEMHAFQTHDFCILATPHSKYVDLFKSYAKDKDRKATIIDPWGIICGKTIIYPNELQELFDKFKHESKC